MFKERMLSLDLARLKINWMSIKSSKHRVYDLALNEVQSVQAEEDMDRFIIQFIGLNEEVLLELAVGCRHERDRILHFFSNLLKWVVENKDSKLFEKMGELDDEEEDSHNKNLIRFRKSLDAYFSTVQLLSIGARYYSTLSGYDFISMKLHGITSPTSSLHSLPKEGSDSSKLLSYALEQETVELTDIIDYTYHEHIPRLLQILCRRLIELKGYNEKGIFRISPGIDEYTQLKSQLSLVRILQENDR